MIVILAFIAGVLVSPFICGAAYIVFDILRWNRVPKLFSKGGSDGATR